MPNILLNIPELYTQSLEKKAKISNKDIQEIIIDAIRQFIDIDHVGENGYDVTQDPVYKLGTAISEEYPTEKFSEQIDEDLYGGDYPL